MTTPALAHAPQAFPVAREPLALAEDALDHVYLPRASWMGMEEDDDEVPCRVTPEGVAILSVCGVIDSRASWLWTGYDEVIEAAEMAFAHAGVAAVVISLDSPGGVAAGMVDTGRALRALADRTGKPLVAHAGPMACSAAYGIAVAADKILVTEDGTVGSVGVIAVTTDRTAQNAAEGLNRRVIASGTMKADGHPDQPITDAALGRMRARVMQLAQMFGVWVATRRGMTPEAVMALQGGVAYGADAVTKGLADATGTLTDAIATAAAMAAARTKEKTMDATATKSIETLAALRGTVDAKTDDELVATFAALRQTASQVPALTAQLAEARAALTAREAADAAKERSAVLDKHAKRGALTPAMQADAAFMGDLAPLSAESLDRVLSRLPGVAAPVDPRAAGVDPKGADALAESVELTAEEKTWAKRMSLSEESVLAVKRADLEREQALRG